jgi:hypothetical protein
MDNDVHHNIHLTEPVPDNMLVQVILYVMQDIVFVLEIWVGIFQHQTLVLVQMEQFGIIY